MKVEFLTENIDALLPLLTKIIPTHSQVPVLSNILLDATNEGFFISATDLEIATRVKVPAKVDDLGSTTISGRHFVEVVNSLVKGKVRLVQAEEKVTLESKDGKIVFQTIPRDEFPQIYEQLGDKVYEFGEGEIQEVFSKIVFVVSQDESRPELTGVYMAQNSEGMDIVATDGFRMSLEKVPQKQMLRQDAGIIVSGKLISELLSLKAAEKVAMYVYEDGNQIVFESGDIFLVGRLIHGNFPNYTGVIPSENKTKVEFDREDFLHALRLSSVFARESANIVKLTITDGRMLFFSRSQGVGEGEVGIDVKQDGDDNEISFNVKYLLDLLKNVPTKTILLEFNSPLEPALFTTTGDTHFLHVIMPVRVQE